MWWKGKRCGCCCQQRYHRLHPSLGSKMGPACTCRLVRFVFVELNRMISELAEFAPLKGLDNIYRFVLIFLVSRSAINFYFFILYFFCMALHAFKMNFSFRNSINVLHTEVNNIFSDSKITEIQTDFQHVIVLLFYPKNNLN